MAQSRARRLPFWSARRYTDHTSAAKSIVHAGLTRAACGSVFVIELPVLCRSTLALNAFNRLEHIRADREEAIELRQFEKELNVSVRVDERDSST